MKIAIIGVYFGSFPEYFNLWLLSCKKNPKIDFFVFTDQIIMNKPNNVKIIKYSLEEMKRKAEEVLQFDCSLSSPYKCCDYKPLFGLLFSDYLTDYDYWGHCDFDMLFGDLYLFFSKNSLEKYDKFLPLGHLSLYKNTDTVNHRFMDSGAYVDYKTVYSSNENYGFDEIDGMAAIYSKNKYSYFDKKIFADIDQKHRRFRLSEYCVPKNEKLNYSKQIFYWEDGKVFRAKVVNGLVLTDEYCYIHFQKRKHMKLNNVSDKTTAFFITDRGFFKKEELSLEQAILLLNKSYGGLYELFEDARFVFNLARKRCIRRAKKYLKRASK